MYSQESQCAGPTYALGAPVRRPGAALRHRLASARWLTVSVAVELFGKKLMSRAVLGDLWRNAGARYRLGLLLILLGLLAFIPSGIALGMLLTNQAPGTFGWASLVFYAIGIPLIILGNWMRFRAMAIYRERHS